jgi:hypothetical protein
MLVQSFTPFACFPVEIRDMIWGAAIWTRLVHLVGRCHEDIRNDTASEPPYATSLIANALFPRFCKLAKIPDRQ